ncbi:MAG TPA: hypothetical protein VFO66_05260 [Gemmatimonadaceae bacterium]|nr:hypothetical protein [Gemmatimonadaceae bacterium]
MTVRRLTTIAIAALAVAAPLGAQDSARVSVDTVATSPAVRPPLSPRRAFVYSLVLPGYAQSILGRGRTGTLLLAFESAALVMIRESAGNLREARRNLADSVIVSYVDAEGQPVVTWERTPFSAALVRSRQEQLEDWIAVLAGNHLFSAIDAYVAAHLWDVPLEVEVRSSSRRRGLALRLYW